LKKKQKTTQLFIFRLCDTAVTMGNANGTNKSKAPQLKQSQLDEYVGSTNFTAPEIKALYFHFGQLASDEKGELLIKYHFFFFLQLICFLFFISV